MLVVKFLTWVLYVLLFLISFYSIILIFALFSIHLCYVVTSVCHFLLKSTCLLSSLKKSSELSGVTLAFVIE